MSSGTYGANGATPVASPTIANTTWNLYKGPNGSTTVFSFVADSEVPDFSGDIMDFFDYLTENEGLSSSQYLTSVGAGELTQFVAAKMLNNTN
jgi:xyloglucan-specific endo-beta-1,4-glucanase